LVRALLPSVCSTASKVGKGMSKEEKHKNLVRLIRQIVKEACYEILDEHLSNYEHRAKSADNESELDMYSPPKPDFRRIMSAVNMLQKRVRARALKTERNLNDSASAPQPLKQRRARTCDLVIGEQICYNATKQRIELGHHFLVELYGMPIEDALTHEILHHVLYILFGNEVSTKFDRIFKFFLG